MDFVVGQLDIRTALLCMVFFFMMMTFWVATSQA